MLLRRVGLALSESRAESGKEYKPIKKTVLPWSQQAAKLEADSREKYWKKQIELREQPQEVRREKAEHPDSNPKPEDDFDKDMAELNDVSSNNS